jgi:hypothetical protein
MAFFTEDKIYFSSLDTMRTPISTTKLCNIINEE